MLDADVLSQFSAAYKSVSKKVMRGRVLHEGIRIDGRGLTDIRPLDAEVQVIPRVHGSAIFQRGETQILGVTTLNMLKMEQQIDSLSPVTKKRYLHHYNFPPYSTGETGRVGSPKRREIGHGFLAERALVPVLPSREEFPYAIRQVSEALSSNGSTSMGSVCASTLSLLNAGVPLRAPVAGIAMGLISDEVDGETRYAALTDILGAEDALGDMDFKVAGTSEFVTAIQLDTKLDGIPSSVLAGALKQAKDARTTILERAERRDRRSGRDGPDRAARDLVQIPVDKIGELIGPKGKTINAIQDETGADISIEEDGTVYIGAVDGPSAEAARAQVNAIANPTNPEVGEQFLGTVVKIADVRCVRLAAARQGRPAAHLRGAQARRWQACRERRRRARRRPEDPGRDHQDRRPRKAVARSGARRRGVQRRSGGSRRGRGRGRRSRSDPLEIGCPSRFAGAGIRRLTLWRRRCAELGAASAQALLEQWADAVGDQLAHVEGRLGALDAVARQDRAVDAEQVFGVEAHAAHQQVARPAQPVRLDDLGDPGQRLHDSRQFLLLHVHRDEGRERVARGGGIDAPIEREEHA